MKRFVLFSLSLLLVVTVGYSQGLVEKLRSTTSTMELMGVLRAPASKSGLLSAEKGVYPIDIVMTHGLDLVEKEGVDALYTIEACVKFLTENGLDLNKGKKSAYIRSIENISERNKYQIQVLAILHSYGGNPLQPSIKKSYLLQVIGKPEKQRLDYKSFVPVYLREVAKKFEINYSGKVEGMDKTWMELAATEAIRSSMK